MSLLDEFDEIVDELSPPFSWCSCYDKNHIQPRYYSFPELIIPIHTFSSLKKVVDSPEKSCFGVESSPAFGDGGERERVELVVGEREEGGVDESSILRGAGGRWCCWRER